MLDIKDALAVVSVADSVGVVSRVNAHRHPICSAETGGPFSSVNVRNLN